MKNLAIEDLDFVVATLRINNGLQLTFMAPSDIDSSGHLPAQSVTIYGTDRVKRLRDMLNRAIPT